MAANQPVRKGPYEPIDVHRQPFGTAEDRKTALAETLLWGWSALLVLGAAYGIHEIFAQGSFSFVYLLVGLCAAVLIGATEYHIVCNVLAPASSSPRKMLALAAGLCLGFLFVFNHVAVVSALGTPRIAYDTWFRSVTDTNTSVSTALETIEHNLEQLVGAQYEPRGEEEVNGDADVSGIAPQNVFSAPLQSWNDAFTALSAPLKASIEDFSALSRTDDTERARAARDAVTRALTGFNAQIGTEGRATGFSRYLTNPAELDDPAAQQHLRQIDREISQLQKVTVADLPRDRSAGIGALRRLGGLIASPFTGDPPALTTRDYIGLGTSALALLFVLLLQVNRQRFAGPSLPEPPDNLDPASSENYREPQGQ